MTQPLIFDGPRLMRPDERLASGRLFAACFGGNSEDETAGFSFEETPGNETCVITHEGKLVSQIGTFAELLVVGGAEVRVGSIGGVGTHPDYRGYGLASQLMEFCTARLHQAGTHILFISGARGLYTRLGNVPAGCFQRFVLRPDQLQGTQPLAELRLAEERDAEPCSQVYDSELVHFLRPVSVFTDSFRSREISFQAEKWVIEHGGVPLGYLMLNVPWDDVDQPQTGVRSVFEYAGERAALSRVFLDLAIHRGLSDLEVLVPWQDEALATRLRIACATAETGTVPLPDHSLRIIHFPALMQALDPIITARLGANVARGLRFEQSGPLLAGSGADQCVIALGEERLALDGAAMSRLVFGDSSGSNPASSLPRGALREAVEAIFPLPSFFAGLNFH